VYRLFDVNFTAIIAPIAKKRKRFLTGEFISAKFSFVLSKNNRKIIPLKILLFKIFYLLENEFYYIFDNLQKAKLTRFCRRRSLFFFD